jgi:hypothetical protein
MATDTPPSNPEKKPRKIPAKPPMIKATAAPKEATET